MNCLPYLAIVIAVAQASTAWAEPSPWKRHTIDASLRGADGVRLGDFNRDGLPDVATGWEESGRVRIYLHPGVKQSTSPWPAVTVGVAASPEDAIPIDLDGDGHTDVLSCHEGKRREVLVHWNHAVESSNDQLLDPGNWETRAIDQLSGQLWMYAVETTVAGRRAVVLGSKGRDATITLLWLPDAEADAEAASRRDTGRWETMRLRRAGWIMSLETHDMDGDGDLDIVFSDRKGDRTGAAWLEQPDGEAGGIWNEHPIAGQGREVMFLSAAPQRCLVGTRNAVTLDCVRSGDTWNVTRIANPEGVPLGKAVEPWPAGGFLLTSNTLSAKPPGAAGLWLRDDAGKWTVIDPLTRVKFDRMELLDLDGDGDLDVMTCEERRNLGVIWYENPAVAAR